MRKVIYGGACSLDGFLAGPGGSLDWLHFSKDVEAVTAKSWAEADTLLWGRKTWDFSQGVGGGPPTQGFTQYVFSRTLTEAPGAQLVNEDAGAFVRNLKQRSGKDILVMSGGNLAGSLLAAGVIDEIGLNIHPLLLGSGVPAFPDAGVRIQLELVEARPIEGGCVMVRYQVVAPSKRG